MRFPIVVLFLLGLVIGPVWASAQEHVGDEGCTIDPAGGCLDKGDAGPVIDPDGLHSKIAALPAGDAGPVIDPWGVAGR